MLLNNYCLVFDYFDKTIFEIPICKRQYFLSQSPSVLFIRTSGHSLQVIKLYHGYILC